jgi:hypothetical protein
MHLLAERFVFRGCWSGVSWKKEQSEPSNGINEASWFAKKKNSWFNVVFSLWSQHLAYLNRSFIHGEYFWKMKIGISITGWCKYLNRKRTGENRFLNALKLVRPCNASETFLAPPHRTNTWRKSLNTFEQQRRRLLIIAVTAESWNQNGVACCRVTEHQHNARSLRFLGLAHHSRCTKIDSENLTCAERIKQKIK